MSRKITIKAFKYNPLSKISKPHFATYELEESDGMTIFVALTQIREKFDPELSFDFVCRAGICGSCAMLINGVPKLACRTLTKDYEDGVIELMPLPVFKLIKDLSVNTGKWMNGMNKRVEAWVHTDKKVDFSKVEEKIEPEIAEDVFEIDRCIECGICVASCGNAIMREDFVGAVGINKVARFAIDPHDNRKDSDFYELIGDDSGIFGCMSLLGCEDNCPKHLPLQSKIAYIRRKLATNKN